MSAGSVTPSWPPPSADAREVMPADEGLLARLARIPDPRSPQGMRYRLASLLAIGVCALSVPGHNSLTAVAEWVHRAPAQVLARLGLPFDVFTGNYRVPDEKTLRDAYARADPGELAKAGFAHLRSLTPSGAAKAAPDGVSEREQRRVRQADQKETAVRPPRRRAYAVDGKCLRGAQRPDGNQVFVLSAVRHGDAVTTAARQIGAKTNEIPEFAPLLDQMADADLAGAIVTVDAMHAQRSHATYLVTDRHAHYLVAVKNNQPTLARQVRQLPWRQVPVLYRDDSRGHGRVEQRRVQVVTVEGLLFPHARQVLRIQRKRRAVGTRKWSTETVYAVTDLPAEQASAAELSAWARGHWTIENSVHWIRDVTFGEDASCVRTHNTPAVLAGLRDIVRSAIRLSGWANTASGRRAHTNPNDVLALHNIP